MGTSLLVATLISACGDSGDANSPPPPPAPPPAPTVLNYGPPQTYTVGTLISPLSPTVSGTVTSYAVTPALPAGLAINGTNGVISGTPDAVAATTNYTITASNSGGSSSTGLSITVNDRTPVFAYPQTTLALTTGIPISVTPNSTGGTVTTWSIVPALPAGLGIDAATGVISGTPTVVTAVATYRVRAQNTGGQASVDLSISVQSGVLLDLGHVTEVQVIRIAGTRVLSRDNSGHWVLWNKSDAAQLAEGEALCITDPCPIAALKVDLAGNTLATEIDNGIEIRDAADGRLISTIAGRFAWWQLARDGSYLSAGTTNALRTWSRAGTEVVNRTGDYHLASVFAAAGELRIARGAAAADVIEYVSPVSGATTTSPAFLGTFQSWFGDGEKFLTSTGTTVRTYSRMAAQLDITALPTIGQLAGYGEYFWSAGGSPNTLRIYRVGASSTPVASHVLPTNTEVVASGAEIALLAYGAGSVARIDLGGITPTRTDLTVPNQYLKTFATDSSGSWFTGASFGVLTDQTTPGGERSFGYGAAFSIVGAPSRVVIATASGRIVFFDSTTRTLEGSIYFPSDSLSLSADGSVLAAAGNQNSNQYYTDRSIRLFSLPAGTEIHTWPYTYGSVPYPLRMSLSASGTVLAQDFTSGLQTTRQTNPATGGATIFSDTVACSAIGTDCPQTYLSPDGTYVAASNPPISTNAGTNLLENGVLVNAVPGWALGWQSDSLLLVNIFGGINGMPPMLTYTETRLYNRSGQLQRTVSLPFFARTEPIQAVGADGLYIVRLNAIYSTIDGSLMWSTPSPTRRVGAVAGPAVVFASGSAVRIESR